MGSGGVDVLAARLQVPVLGNGDCSPTAMISARGDDPQPIQADPILLSGVNNSQIFLRKRKQRGPLVFIWLCFGGQSAIVVKIKMHLPDPAAAREGSHIWKSKAGFLRH